MALKADSKLGPYEIVGLLGAGGMGEVYRARDRRLGRDVAVKMLLSSVAADSERLRRFEQEARAVALLNHPGILQIYDTGIQDGMPYLVMELLEGETLRERLKGRPLPLRKVLEFGQQIARGLAAAHEKGLTHRDLKPENIFVTDDERVKILDFGLAKQRASQPMDAGETQADPTMPIETEPGMVVGTVGYMSPEQVTGRPADYRSDIFAFGVILWEMISGNRPFHGKSAVEVMHAILKDDPPELPADLQLPVPLHRTLLRCLEKEPWARFQSAQDLAFDLENVLISSTSASRALRVAPVPRLRPRVMVSILGTLVLAAGAYWVGAGQRAKAPPILHRLTYRTGEIQNARFAPDAQSFVYSLSGTNDPGHLWLGRVEGLGARSLELPAGTEILAIASTGEMAVLLRPAGGAAGSGILARAPLSGGAPREILERVRSADWSPDGKQLAVVCLGEKGQQLLEYPIGRRLFEAPPANAIECPKVSPKGDKVAFTEIVSAGNQSLSVVDSEGRRSVLARGEIQSLAWAPDGREVIYTLRLPEDRQELRAVTQSGRQRLIYSVLGRLSIQDVSSTGKVLLRHSLTRQHLFLGQEGGRERELSWLQSSKVADLAQGGKGLLFAESREGAGPGGAYFRKVDGTDAVRLGDGDPMVLSPDGKWAVVRGLAKGGAELALLPTGPGEAKRLPSHGVKAEWAAFLGPQTLLLGGVGADKVFRYHQQDLQSGDMKPWLQGPGRQEAYGLVSHDGIRVILGPVDGKLQLYKTSGELLRELPGFPAEDIPLQWSADGRELFVSSLEGLPVKVWRLDLATGQRRLWRELMPADTVGVTRLNNVCVSPDGKTYAYSFLRVLSSDLYFMEGWQ